MSTPTPAPGLPPFDQYKAALTQPPAVERGEEPQSLTDLIVYLGHVIEDLDIIDEHITAHRHQTLDSSVVVELHAIGDGITLAWAEAKRAKTALENLAATL